MEEILKYEHVQVCFNGRPVVNDVSFSLRKGEILGIVGESGSGKSTLLRAAMGLLGSGGLVTRGDIWFDGADLPDLPPKNMRQLRGARLGMIFQDGRASLCPIRTIESQMYESLNAHKNRFSPGKHDPSSRQERNISRPRAREMALDLFEKLNLPDGERVLKSYPFELSGGMNQRVCIAMAVLKNPDVLLADEPTSALDVRTQKQIVDTLARLHRELDMSMIIVSHDMAVIKALADHVLVLKDGNVMEYGPTSRVFSSPASSYTKLLLESVPRIRPQSSPGG